MNNSASWSPAAGSRAASTDLPDDSQFSKFRFESASQRTFMLYEPSLAGKRSAPLLVLLHGCGQGAADFAAGTRMNEAARETGVFVLYPEQNAAANAMRCWNWYTPGSRADSGGDAALIAAMTRHVIAEFEVDPCRVYIAGMSAGGAMAAVLARDYPELYAALGVHSGIPAGHARDLCSALRLMSSGPPQGGHCSCGGAGHGVAGAMRTIVFHGDRDTTVHPSNGQAIHARARCQPNCSTLDGSFRTTTDADAGQLGFTRSVDIGPTGTSDREHWLVHGAGHAWAGGSDAHSYTDALGPDASREMLRFFLQHRLPEASRRPLRRAVTERRSTGADHAPGP
jgi:poly(hydroxyalkanoate) depolymerase family esterase